jgi:hypothetical protein
VRRDAMREPGFIATGIRRAILAALLVAAAPGALWAAPRGPDAGGYTATDATVSSFIDISGASGGTSTLAGTDDAAAALTLPFTFQFYGHGYTVLCVSSNGALYFPSSPGMCSGIVDFANTDLTTTATPGDTPALLPFWSDLSFQAPGAGSVFYQTLGAAGSRRFVVQWNNAYPDGSSSPVTFQVILSEGTNNVLFQYKTVALEPGNPAGHGVQATVGIRNAGAPGNHQELGWSHEAGVLNDNTAILFSAGTAPVVPGIVVTGGTFTFDGNPHPATATATGAGGAGVAGSFAFTYAPGGSAPPVNSGTYGVVANFTSTDPGYTNGTGTGTVTINPATPAITWANPAPIQEGAALSGTQLDATANVAGTFVYTPAAGAVLAVGAQTLSVTFTPTDTTDYTTATSTVTLMVSATTTPPTVTFTGAPPSAVYGSSFAVSAVTNASTSAVITARGACSVMGSTVTMTSGTGMCRLTAKWAGDANYTAASATQTTIATKADPGLAWAAPSPITYRTPLSATQLDATASVPGTFVYHPALGSVLAGGTRTLSVTFRPTAAADYATTTASVALVVNQLAPSIAWAQPAAITYGTKLSAAELDARASALGHPVAGTFVYVPARGTVLGAGSHTLSVTFTPTNAADYATATAPVTLVVNQDTPDISWPKPPAIVYGTALSATQLKATSSVPGTFVYSPAADAVLNAGAQILSVTFTPADATDYTTATKTVTLSVTRATPSVIWTTPAPVAHGTALSATQLDATATVAGTFAYSPGAGTVLAAGTHTLSVTFTPDDTTDYQSVVQKATLVVTQ